MTGRRLIVTGHDADGTAVVVRDEIHEPRTSPGLPGVELNYLWGADTVHSYPDAGDEPAWTSHFPPVGGFRFVSYRVPPADFIAPADAHSDENQAHALVTFPGLLDTYEDDGSGMHRSDTTDVAVVLSGEIVLGLSDGSETVLRAGDTIVQNGTAHSWTNRTREPAEMLFVLIGAERSAS